LMEEKHEEPSDDARKLPKDNKVYKQKEYWNSRFANEETYDWLSDYDSFRELLSKEIATNHRILIVGCGNSELSARLYESGYHNIVNVDFSETCIENQRRRHQHMPDMTWQVMNMLNLEFGNSSFDVVVDKAAMDALVVDEGDPWNPKQSVRDEVRTMMQQISRVLKPAGKLLQISFQQPHFRRAYVAKDEYGWGFEVQTFGDGLGYFFYVMRKNGNTS